jgi:uncharacterized membrane protein
MELTHLHLLLNHFPTVGNLIGGGLLLFALATKSSELKRASLIVLLGISLIGIPTYITGNGAQHDLQSLPDETKSLIAAHESAALVAFGLMELTGGFAWLALWQLRRLGRIPIGIQAAILVLTVATFGLMARAANIGGEIRHPEIGVSQALLSPELTLARQIGSFATETPWVWPTCETLHFIGLTLLLGVVLLVDLRVLGIVRGVSYAALHRLLPLAAIGFAVNVVTGMLFFVGIPGQYIGNVSFYWKIALVLVAGVNALYFTISEDPWALGPEEEAPMAAKFAAASAMVLWIGVMYCGSMLPFLGNAF